MPNVPQLNIRRDFGTPPKDKPITVYKPLGYRKYAKNDIKPTVLIMPDPFKCSRCQHIAESRDGLRKHWTIEH